MSNDTIATVAVMLLIWISGGVTWTAMKLTKVETLLKAHTEDGRVHNFGTRP